MPAAAASNVDTYARFRFNESGGLTPTGSAFGGEVEDYQVHIEAKTPDSVGGTTSFLTDGSGSSGSIALFAGGVAAIVALVAGGWYTRRRWLIRS